jgi:hypothetical protein
MAINELAFFAPEKVAMEDIKFMTRMSSTYTL